MRSCYVSMPFGVRLTVDGRVLDFDFLYATVIQEAVQEIGVECRRLDDVAPGALLHSALFEQIISSDVMIADLSTQNPNVLYELGVRHALRRGRTLLVACAGELAPWAL